VRRFILSPQVINSAGTRYTYYIDGLRGAVLQMIAHGFVVVGYFSSLKLFLEDKLELLLKWVVFVHNHQNCFDVFAFSISICCIPTTFNFVGEFTVLYSLLKLIYGLPLRNNYHLGAYYMLKMYQQVMLGETNKKYLRMLL
jgi:NADH-quinone oxidoreductase subunit M